MVYGRIQNNGSHQPKDTGFDSLRMAGLTNKAITHGAQKNGISWDMINLTIIGNQPPFPVD